MVSLWIAADGTGVLVGIVETLVAEVGLRPRLYEGIGEGAHLLFLGVKNVVGQTLRRLSSNAGQPTELVNLIGNGPALFH